MLANDNRFYCKIQYITRRGKFFIKNEVKKLADDLVKKTCGFNILFQLLYGLNHFIQC